MLPRPACALPQSTPGRSHLGGASIRQAQASLSPDLHAQPLSSQRLDAAARPAVRNVYPDSAACLRPAIDHNTLPKHSQKTRQCAANTAPCTQDAANTAHTCTQDLYTRCCKHSTYLYTGPVHSARHARHQCTKPCSPAALHHCHCSSSLFSSRFMVS
jgi:hypothetical protein